MSAPLTGLVGRDRELTEVCRLLSRARLVTLTGAGGVGKTRLALAVAEALGDSFPDGMAFVDLAPATQPGAVPSAIARDLGIRDDGALPLAERLANALHDRQFLLILDNFEQVMPAATLVLELLQAAPRLTVLVTSRAALRVRGEREFPVAPLACPVAIEDESPDALLRYPAVSLFIRRAQDVRPDFALATGNVAAVGEICRQLDGLPLALELAAARIRALSPEAMLGLLGRRLSLLTGGPRDLPARQQTLRATMAWSYGLLTTAERALFRCLAIFIGDFSLDAAVAVAGTIAASGDPAGGVEGETVPPDPVETLDLLAALVEKSLLWRREGQKGEPRFRMFETVREFGLEQLEAQGETASARRAHADYFAAFVERVAPQLRGARREQWLRRFDAELDNLRAVVAWSSADGDGGAALLRVVGASSSWYYWRIVGSLREGLHWCELALATPAAAPPSAYRMRLLWTAGGLAGYLGQFALVRPWLEESVRLARVSGDEAMRGLALVFLGWAESHLGEQSAAAYLAEALAILRRLGDLPDLALALNVAAPRYLVLGDLAAARIAVAEALVTARELGDDWALAGALGNAGALELQERNWSAARAHLEQARALYQQLGDEGSVATLLNNLAITDTQLGDDASSFALLDQSLAQLRRLGLNTAITLSNLGDWALRHRETARAAAYLAEGLRTGVRGGEQRAIVANLGGLSRLAVGVRQPEVAARLFGAAEALGGRAGAGGRPDLRRELERAADVARTALGAEAFAAAMADGRTMPLAQLAVEALAWVESLPARDADGRRPTVHRAAPPPPPGDLSPRELEVLRLIAEGKNNREIADILVISPNTVARHVSNIFDKVGAANRTEAAAFAHRHGIAH